MCLRKHFKTKKEALEFKEGQVLKEDMIVWKSLDKGKNKGEYLSPWQGFPYEKGQHYYQTGKNGIGIKIKESFFGSHYAEINEGLHSCLSRKHALKIYGTTAVKMIIPKGARVWISKVHEEVVSTELIFPH